MASGAADTRPLVAIVGRPNVGKSSLFNRIIGERRAIVEPTPGVTRDRLVLPVSMPEMELDFDLMDTGGIGIVDREDLADSVAYQALTAVHSAELILFLVDAREGLTLLDREVAGMIRRADRRILLLANKCESREASMQVGEFGELGLGEARPISAQEGLGLNDLYEELQQHLPVAQEVDPAGGKALRITILGRRNTGKSSFINALVGDQRVIVSEIPGTTRDAVEVDFRWKDHPIRLVDTAGVHRRAKVGSAVEYFSLTRSDQASRLADVALLFLDLTQPIARQDQELARRLADRYKPVVVVGTKSDLVPDMRIDEFRERVRHKLPHLRGAPVAMISNTAVRGFGRVMQRAFDLHEEAQHRVGTGELNRALAQTFERQRFRGRGEKPKAYYVTQVRTGPPTFMLFVNRAQLFDKEAVRAISRELRQRLNFERVPIRLVLREKARLRSRS